MAIPAARPAAVIAVIIMTFGIKIHENGLSEEGEIHLADICTL